MQTLFPMTPPPEAPADPLARASFVQTHTRRDDPPSSTAAAERVSLNANSQCGRLLAKLKEGPISSHDLQAWCIANRIGNFRARISDIRGWNIPVHVSDEGVYSV